MEEEALILSPARCRAGWAWMAFFFLLLPQLVGLLGLSSGSSNLLLHAVGFLVGAVLFRPLLLEGAHRARAHWRRFFAVCALALLGYYLSGWAISRLIGGLAPDYVNQNDRALAGEPWGLLFVTTVLLSPLGEECLFRGLLFTQLWSKSPAAAYSLSSLCFSLIHVLGYVGVYSPGELLLALCQYLPAGLLLAWARRRCGLLAPICIHAIINAVSMMRILR